MLPTMANEYRDTHIAVEATNPLPSEENFGNTLMKRISSGLGFMKLLSNKSPPENQPENETDKAVSETIKEQGTATVDEITVSRAPKALPKNLSGSNVEDKRVTEIGTDEAQESKSPARELRKKISRGVKIATRPMGANRESAGRHDRSHDAQKIRDFREYPVFQESKETVSTAPVHPADHPSPSPTHDETLSASSRKGESNKKLRDACNGHAKTSPDDTPDGLNAVQDSPNDNHIHGASIAAGSDLKFSGGSCSKSRDICPSSVKQTVDAQLPGQSPTVSVTMVTSADETKNSNSSVTEAKLLMNASNSLHITKKEPESCATRSIGENASTAILNKTESNLRDNTTINPDIPATSTHQVSTTLTAMPSLSTMPVIASSGVHLPLLDKERGGTPTVWTPQKILAMAAVVQKAALQVQNAAAELDIASETVRKAALDVKEAHRRLNSRAAPVTIDSADPFGTKDPKRENTPVSPAATQEPKREPGPAHPTGPEDPEKKKSGESQPLLEKRTSSSTLIKKISDKLKLKRFFSSTAPAADEARLERISSPMSPGTSDDDEDGKAGEAVNGNASKESSDHSNDSPVPESGPGLLKKLSGKIDIRKKLFHRRRADTPSATVPPVAAAA